MNSTAAWLSSQHSARWGLRMIMMLTILMTLGTATMALQQPARPAPPPFKGIWEPVSFPEDIDLRDVFFVTVDVGWASGAKGTIIHTQDGGATWTAQLGGDPQAADLDISALSVVDGRHGWAAKDKTLLRTTDGESWEELPSLPFDIRGGAPFAFISPTEGVAVGAPTGYTSPLRIWRTQDGGRTWKPVADLQFKVMRGGLAQTIELAVLRFHFPTPTVGYLVANQRYCGSSMCDHPPVLGKTQDGGETWRFFTGGHDDNVSANDLFFIDEATGLIQTHDLKLSRTTDGGNSWSPVIANLGTYNTKIRFADPEVGWALSEIQMAYTVDGGRRWTTPARQLYSDFPTRPRAWSFPRRDRAYAVGAHGMVMRYRVVPQAEPLRRGAAVAPAMPAFASPLDNQVTEFQAALNEIATAVEQVPAAAPAGPGAAPTPSAPADPVFAQDAPLTPFVNACCAKSVNKLSVILGAVIQSLPQFVAKFRNTNLLVAGLRMLSTMPAQLGELRTALRGFRGATDRESAKAALAQVGTTANALAQSTKEAFQK